MHSYTPFLIALSLSTCSTDPMTPPQDAGCCSNRAVDVSYSNTTSQLASTNVQAAIDEVAAKPVEAPVGPRIERVQTQTANNHQASFGAEAACPDEVHDIVLSGDCSAGPAAQLVSTQITLLDGAASGGPKARYGCLFSQPTTSNDAATVGVLCLRNAR